MKVLYQEEDWKEETGLYRAVSRYLPEQKRETTSIIISLVGGGGKTSLIRRLAYEGVRQGMRVLVTTTTHMAMPTAYALYECSRERMERMLWQNRMVITGRAETNGKISGWEYLEIRPLCDLADLVLIEADGSKRLPLKVPAAHEPVIWAESDLILCVAGLSALDRPAGEVCFRLSEAEALLNTGGEAAFMNRIIGEKEVALLLNGGYLKPLRGGFPKSRVIPVLNQADTPVLEERGKRILQGMGERGLITRLSGAEPSASLF